jgi:hypothetical protein
MAQVLNDGAEGYWELLEDGICFRARAPDVRVVKFFRFASGQLEHVTELPEGTSFTHGFAVSPDGRWTLHALLDRYETDIMLVENFR